MIITIDNNEIKRMVEQQTKEEVRKRIKEMQGYYTSKAFIENIIRDVIWDKIYELCPDVENYIMGEVKRCVESATSEVREISKQQLVSEVIDGLFEKFENRC